MIKYVCSFIEINQNYVYIYILNRGKFVMESQQPRLEKLNKQSQVIQKQEIITYKMIGDYALQIDRLLGKGAYGVVRKGYKLQKNNKKKELVVKIIPVSQIKDDKETFKEIFNHRFGYIKKCQNLHLVKLDDVKLTKNNLYVFQQLCDKDTLEDIFRQNIEFQEEQVVDIMRQLIAGYRQLYDKGVIHGDIKPSNILLKGKTYKLSDYGLLDFYNNSLNLSEVYHCIITNPMYNGPQILKGQPLTQKSDIWSLGVVFYQLLYKKTPIEATSIKQLCEKINSNKIIFPKQSKDQRIQKLILNMLRVSQDERISWKEVFNHDLFSKKAPMSYAECEQASKKHCQQNKKDIFQIVMNDIYFKNRQFIQDGDFLIDEEQKINQKKQVEKVKNQKDIVLNIKNWFIKKQNKAVYLNQLALKIFKFFQKQQQKIGQFNQKQILQNKNCKISQQEINVLLFSLVKMQCRFTYMSYFQLKNGALHDTTFTQQQFQIFCNYKLKDQLNERVKFDFMVMKLGMEYFFKKVQKYIEESKVQQNKQKNIQNDQNLNEIKKICHFNLDPQKLITQILTKNIQEFKKVFQNIVFQENNKKIKQQQQKEKEKGKQKSNEMIVKEDKKNKASSQALQIYYMLIRAIDMIRSDLSSYQISEIYQNLSQCNEEQLMKEINYSLDKK